MKERSKKSGILRPFVRFIILIISMFIYLAIGAVVFNRLENDNNIASQRKLYESLIEFMDDHPCLSNESLQYFFENVDKAIEMSVVSVTRQSRIRDSSALWDIPTSFFFTSTIVTTIGYGNFAPKTDGGRIFCSFYAFIGIPLTGWFLLTIGDALQVYWNKIRHQTHRLTVKIPHELTRRCIHFIIYSTFILIILLLFPGFVLMYTEGWSYQDAVYYCFITFSTIGFGDLVAGDSQKHNVGLWILNVTHVVFLLMGLSIMSMALKGMGNSQKTSYKRAKTAVRDLVQKASRKKRQKSPPVTIPIDLNTSNVSKSQV
ncbi:potassium channel subfamily K member 4-like [Lytechinus variegatus]|uniref:potassium channel subfamily K member 4-like n=1 Tax=Lytechinus variegatus TaxID=7654 RepID=UPI001BB0E910|nr:potassium channel subfamily K member 4-like [Lytechinus variegatus]